MANPSDAYSIVPLAAGMTDSQVMESPQPTADPNDPRTSSISDFKKEKGQSGTLVLSGFINGEEYNKDLIGRAGLMAYDQMRKSDATVSMSLKILKLPILAATWDVDAASDSDEDQYIARCVKNALFERINWQDTLREFLTHLEFGYYVGEKVFCPAVFENRLVLTLKKIGSRKQTSILKWTQADGTPGITQVTGTGGIFSIPSDKLVVITNEREGNNFAGVSVLRPAYKHYYIKNQLYQISAIAHERQGLGVVYIQPPDNVDEDDRLKAQEAARNIRAAEDAYIEVPQGWIIEFMDMKGHTTIDPSVDITHHDHQIMKNVLAPFMDMGSHKGSGGTRSSSQDQSKYLDLNLEAIANNIMAVLQREVVQQLVDMNFNVTEYPKLRHSGLGETDITAMSTAMSMLADANLFTPTAETEKGIRAMLNQPELDEDYENNYENRPKNKPANGGTSPEALAAQAAAQTALDNANKPDLPAGDEPSATAAAEIRKVIAATDRVIQHYERT